MTMKEMVYELHLGEMPYGHAPTSAMIREFLDAHGINVHEHRVPQDGEIRVIRSEDGSFQLSTRIFREGLPICPECKDGILQEDVDVPLAAPVPVIPGAFFWPAADDTLPRVLPEDAHGMAEAAERMFLDQHSRDVGAAVDRLRRRQDRLDTFRSMAVVSEVSA